VLEKIQGNPLLVAGTVFQASDSGEEMMGDIQKENSSADISSFFAELQERIEERANELEDLHLDAAIDAQLIRVGGNEQTQIELPVGENIPIFTDYTNPNAVANCFSPFVPTPASRVQAFAKLSRLSPKDVVLDIGCGDGRVCIGVCKVVGCRSCGLDVSPPCISLARQIAKEEGIDITQCSFHQVDATVDASVLLEDGEFGIHLLLL